MMEFFGENSSQLLDTSIIDTFHGSKYASEPQTQYLLYSIYSWQYTTS